jgi:hypothetical protein
LCWLQLKALKTHLFVNIIQGCFVVGVTAEVRFEPALQEGLGPPPPIILILLTNPTTTQGTVLAVFGLSILVKEVYIRRKRLVE